MSTVQKKYVEEGWLVSFEDYQGIRQFVKMDHERVPDTGRVHVDWSQTYRASYLVTKHNCIGLYLALRDGRASCGSVKNIQVQHVHIATTVDTTTARLDVSQDDDFLEARKRLSLQKIRDNVSSEDIALLGLMPQMIYHKLTTHGVDDDV